MISTLCRLLSNSIRPIPRPRSPQLPQSQAVFALYGAEARAEPYIGRTPNLRARLERLLQPSAKHPRRLHLAGLVRRIEWQLTGSEFESLLAQFSLDKDRPEPWRLNRTGRHGTEAGNCRSGCAKVISGPSTPRSPKARDRGHPQLDKIPLRPGPPANETGEGL